ncbi:hypothetical protein [Streptomyces cylindrosporus]|uniref:Uncharacterized protein n=1 Tax=Streptomyces cylindrosporus TaxID=2927583 RepID=A0ABS9Y1I3_9ACTN|nr:hypothetical protein [Streptomyces cylindrosporus]MCI3271057.1 hypothetical protein [Streptomyces cylindrosporus]
MESESPAFPPKVRTYNDTATLLNKLQDKAKLWHRTAKENEARANEFDRAAQQVEDGATTVTVGLTTYVVDEERDEGHTQR